MKKIILILSLTINASIVIFFLGKHFYYKYTFSKNIKTTVTDSIVIYKFNKYKLIEARIDLFKTMDISKSDILFLGDSETDFFPVTEIFEKDHAKNRGICASTSKDVLHIITNLTFPDKVFLMIGINDIAGSTPVDSTLNNINRIVKYIQSKNQNAKIYIESILPVIDIEETKKVRIYNTALSNFCTTNNLDFINLYPLFLKGNKLNPALTYDDIHLNGKGYLIWKGVLENYLNK